MESNFSLVCSSRFGDVDDKVTLLPLPEWYSTLKRGSGLPRPEWTTLAYPSEPTRDAVLQWLTIQIEETNILRKLSEDFSTSPSLMTFECPRIAWHSVPEKTLDVLRITRLPNIHWLLCALVASGYPDFSGVLVPELPEKQQRADWDWEQVATYLWKCVQAVEKVVATAVQRDVPAGAIDDRPKLSVGEQKAYQSYVHAELNLDKDDDVRKITDREAYQWLKDFGPEGYELPPFDSWVRYVRKGRKHYGSQKNSPRGNRGARSAIPADKLELRSPESD